MTGSNKSFNFKQVLRLVYQVRSRWIHIVISPGSIINSDTNLTSLLFRSGTNYLSLFFLSMSICIIVIKPSLSIVVVAAGNVTNNIYCNAYNELYLNCINLLLSKFSSLKFWFQVQLLLIHQAIIILLFHTPPYIKNRTV